MITKAVAAAAAALSLGMGPAAGPPVTAAAGQAGAAAAGQPTAAAWLLDITMTSGTTSGVQLAMARARSGPAAQAWGAPITVNGTSYQAAGATVARPRSSVAQVDYTDQTGSMTLNGGYTTASVGGGSSTVRTGLASGSGSGFAGASKLFTWDQQKRLMDEFMALNDAVFDPLNERLQALAPVFQAAGLAVPQLTKMSALAAINVGSGDVDVAQASTASGPGMSSARARATLAAVQLLDGFIRLEDVQATADSQSVDGDESRTAGVRIGNLSVAGVGVTLDEAGFHVLGNDPLQKTTVQPALDQLYASLAENGVTLAVDEKAAFGDLREATAFRLSMSTAQGAFSILVGHVEASAATVAGQPVEQPSWTGTEGDTTPPPSEDGTDVLLPGTSTPSGDTAGPSLTPTTATGSGDNLSPQPSPARRAGVPLWLGATLPAAAGRALGTVFLLLLLAGLGMALIPVVLMRANPAPRRLPLIDPEVLP